MDWVGKNIGNYVVKRLLGEGGMGTVFLGEHPLIGKKVAIKVLLDEFAQREDIVTRFFNEAKAVNEIKHGNIVDIIDFGKMKVYQGAPDTVYFIMELLEGESLSDRLRRQPLSLPEVVHIMLQCCSALEASHAKGIIHRDLKPDNIFITPKSSDPLFIKILDFGIAKLNDGPVGSKTRTGVVIGTPSYMSPEQCMGRGHIDARSDIYSLAIVMYEMLTGKVPFGGASCTGFGEIIIAHMTQPPQPPSEINPAVTAELESVVMRALGKDPGQRFQNMEEFANALRFPGMHLSQWQQGLPAAPPGSQPTMVGTGRFGMISTAGPQPTTLSGAAGQVGGTMVGAPPKKSSAGMIGALAAVAALAVGGGLWWKSRGAAVEPATVAATQQPIKAEAPKTIQVSVSSDPVGAKVFRGDTGKEAEGVTPLSFELKKGEMFDVRVKLDGYTPKVVQVGGERDQSVAVALSKAASAPVAVVPAPAAPVKERHSSSSSSSGAEDKPVKVAKSRKPKAGSEEDLMMPPSLR